MLKNVNGNPMKQLEEESKEEVMNEVVNDDEFRSMKEPKSIKIP